MTRVFKAAVAVFILILMSTLSAHAQTAPDVIVKNTIEEVLRIVRADKDIQAGSITRIAEVMEEKIAPHFDIPRMTRLAVGRSWRDATPEQRDALIREFRTLLIRSYSAAFVNYRDIVVEFRPVRMNPDDTEATVSTQIRLPGNSQPISVEYDMLRTKNDWKAFDVRIDGASLVINYRNVFAEEIQRGGIEGLLRSLVEKNTGNMTTSAKQ